MSRSNRPTLGELRAVVQKDRHREIGNVLARHWARPTAVYGTWVAVRLGLSAHAVTVLALIGSLVGAVLIASGRRDGFVVGVALTFLAFWLDRVDGQVARWNRSASLDGVYFDYVMHHAANLVLGFALGFGLAVRSGPLEWAVAGFAIAAGWTLLSLHNDCRYKALVQRLKRTDLCYHVRGGSGGRPSPPMRWPRRGIGRLTWPLFKSCEAHVVLGTLGLISVVAVVSPAAWLMSWKALVVSQAVLAPGLATMRIARAILGGAAEAEFAAWFEPVVDRPARRSGVSCEIDSQPPASRPR